MGGGRDGKRDRYVIDQAELKSKWKNRSAGYRCVHCKTPSTLLFENFYSKMLEKFGNILRICS